MARKQFSPRRGDRAKFVSNIPADRYRHRWATVLKGGKNGRVVIAYPYSTRVNPMVVRTTDLIFHREVFFDAN